MKRNLAVAAFSMWVLAGCSSDPHAAMRADAEQMDALAHELAQDVADYCAAAPWATGTECADALAGHLERVSPLLTSLSQMAGVMDSHLRDVGATTLADTSCGVPSLRAGLDQHAGVACRTDPGTTEAETLAHCAVLLDGAAQLHARANAVLRATGHSVRMAGSGSMPAHLQPLPTGVHEWSWASEEPGPRPLCGG